MAKKPLQTLYESLRASNYDVPDNYGSFERTLTAPGTEGVRNRQTLYKALRDNNYDVPDTYESFSRTLFSPVKPTGGTAASGQSMLPADVEERRMRTRNKRETHPLNKSRARQRLQAQQQAIENQQKRWEQDNKRFKEDIARREQRLPGGMDRFEERAKEHLATGEAAPVPLAPNDEVVRGDIAFNPDTGRMEQTYTTPEGGTFFDRDAAQFDHSLQNMPDDEIEMLERERELIGMGILRRGRELDEEYENQSWWDRFLAGLGTDPEMGPGPRERMAEDDEELQSLLTAWRKNRNALRILYDERNNDMNSFWHNFGTTVANGYTFTGGRAELHDAQAILNSSKRMDEIQRKMKSGEKLSNVENAALSLANNTAWDNAIQAMYGDDYGAWATAGGAAVQSLEMMPEFIAGMPVLKGMGTAAIKLLTRNAAKGFGRFMLKGLGMTLGTMAGGAIMANTIQAERTLGKAAGKAAGSWWFGDDGEFMLGHYDGDQFVSGGESLAAALFHAEQEAIPEAASEGAGEFLPGIGQVLSKIGLSRIAKPLATLSGKGWYKTYQNMLRAAGWHGVGGEALEEYVGTLDGLIMGDVEGVKRLADPRTHFDIWLSCATLGPLLNAPVVLGSSMRGVYSPVAYHKLKAAVTRQDKIASFRLTEDRWAPWRDRIDATPNEQMADLMVEIRDDQDLAPQEKKAIFDYVKALQGYRGWNLGEYIFGKDAEEDGEGKSEQEQQQSQEYSNGYETVTPEERRAAKDRLDVARARLGEHRFVAETLDGMSIEEVTDLLNLDTIEDEDRAALQEYINARTAYDGMLQRVNDDIDDEVAVANEAIDQRIAPEDQGGDGMIHPAVLKGGREVFIISGNVATLADNSIDVENSDGMIIVRDAEGNEDTISPDNIQSLGEVIDPAQQRQDAEQMIIDEQGQAAAAQIEGQLPFNVGDQYTISYQGEPHTYQVVQADENNVAVLVDGAQEPVVLTRQQLQQMADEEHAQQIQAQAAAADTVEEEPAAVEPEQPVEATAVEETPATPVAPEDNPTAAMPMDDHGEPAWDQVEPERGHQFLYQESGWPQAMADNFVQKRIDDAEKALKKAQDAGQKLIDNPKPTFSAQQQAVAENTAAQQAAQSALDYWKGVKAIQAQATAPVVETPAEQEPTEQAAPVAEAEAPAEPVEEVPAVEEEQPEQPAAPVAENEMQPVEVEQPAEAAPAAPVEENAPQSEATPEQPADAEQVAREEKAANIEAGGAVVDQLQRMGVDVNTDLGEYRKTLSEAKKDKSEAGKVRYLKNSDGTTYGFVYRGKINIDPRKINAELPLHEYGHLWAEAIRAISPDRWQQIVDVLKSDADTWSFLQERRPDLQTDDEIAEEMIAEFSGKNGEAKLKAELERLSKTNSDYKTKWGNIYKNIVKAIQDFWKQVGDFLQIDYTTPQQIYDQVLKDFASGMNPRERVERFLQERDVEFVDAVNRGDMATATRLFNEALTAEVGNGMTPFISVGSHKSSLGNLARKVKRGDKVAIEEVAKLMAPIIPENAVLIPAPSHTGRATYMLEIANAIAKITGSDVADILVGPERGTQYEQKKATGKAMTSAELGVTVEGELPEGKIPVVLDNVVATGNTAEACVQALGKGIVCSLTKATDQYNHAATLKSANVVVRDANGNVIPLSKRFDLSQSKRLGNIEYQDMPSTLPGNRVELNYESGKDAESRAYIEEVMEREGWDEEAKSEFRKILDDAADLVSRMAQGFTRLREWNNKKLTDEQGNYNPLWRVFDKDDGWIPTRSSFKKNGEYPYNIDLGALCTKREAFDAVVRYIKEQGWGQNLGPTQIEALKSLLREHGFLTACDICFNETRRARALDYGNAVAYYWNAVRQAVGIDDDLPIGTPRELTEEQMKRLTELSKSGKAFSKYVPKELRRTYETYVNTKGQTKRREVDKGLTPTMTRKVAKLFLQDPSLMGKFEGTMVLSTDSVDALVRQFPHTDIARFLAGAWGSNTPKPNEGFNIYDPLSWKQTYDKKRQRPAMEWFFNLGGMRAQSFSDYSPIFFYDYVQMFTDLAIRRLPIHIYTKVPALIKLFGGTGAKFNMSLVPEVVQGVDPEHLGLKPDGNGGWVYAWHEDSFPVDEAFALRQDPRFNGNVGTIAVGISDAHIRMLLDDPTIDMVIPYHKSGMPPSIQVKTGLDKATDYTDDQHSKKRGKALKNDFSFNEALRRLGDPRKAADEYLAWCKQNKCTPKYPQFVEHPNYYKVLEDFRCIDNEGNYSPQQPVQVSFFDDVEQRLSESLEDRTMQEGLDSAIRGNDAITEGIKKIMSKPRLDGKIRDMMLARLKQVLGMNNVASLKQEDFFEELQKVYTDQMGAERAQQQVEVLRTSGGIVYGFAVGDRIVLNENYFNAETPMHEFTHVWVKVARLANPKMWAEGKELLKQTKEWQEVMSDEFYRDIQGDEEAVASEVLARIVGQDAARQINEMFAPEDKPQERPGIYNKIKQWVNKFLDGVRSLFDSKAKGLTYDELVRMPMKALFDDAEAARFMEALQQVNEEDVDLSSQGSVPTFYSNAERAVQNVKQNKATAEQWKAMLTKQGGIKAGEDKWMGLSTWLDEHKGETMTKDEVLQFVRDNAVQMEEVNYEDIYNSDNPRFTELQEEYDTLLDNVQAIYDENAKRLADFVNEMEKKYGEDWSANEYRKITPQEEMTYQVLARNQEQSDPAIYGNAKVAFDEMVNRYGDDFAIAFAGNKNGLYISNSEYAAGFLDTNAINETRLDYTTPDLDNKREIAFVVPGVEPYQEHDEIHFGPENQGRAVMWVRFGETTDTEGNRVLVIDEIQSNRHQDAREKGYADPKAVKAFNDWMDAKAKEFGVQPYQVESRLSDEEYHKMMELANAAKYDEGAVPAAPFEKNWHEVAMKRMLRLAAEEGFDKVAWTTGEQQDERYNIGNAVRDINAGITVDGERVLLINLGNARTLDITHDDEGNILRMNQAAQGFFNGAKNIREIVGKEITDGALSVSERGSDNMKTWSGDGLRLGGSKGMSGFYDKMLPSFMNKYGKRWGVKVGEVTLDTPGKETMHSVDVTPEMRRSVMTEGQPLFQTKGVNKSEERTLMGMHNITAEKLRSALKLGGLANPSMAVINTEVGGFTNFGEISLIPGSDMIASSTGRNAGTWGADAYTPRFPETHRRLGKGGDKKLSQWVKTLAQQGMRQEMVYNTEEQFNDYYNGFNIRDNALVYPFLFEKGLADKVEVYDHNQVSQRFREIVERFNGDIDRLMDAYRTSTRVREEISDALITDAVFDSVRKQQGESFSDLRKRRLEFRKEYTEAVVGEDGRVADDVAYSVLSEQCKAYNEGSKFNPNETRGKAVDYLLDNGMYDEYQRYFEQKMQELGAENQVYAGHDNMGRSKFKPANLEEISRKMKSQGRAGGEGWIFSDGPGAIRAKLLTPMKTLDQIRKEKGRIVNKEEFDKAREEYQDKLRDYAYTYADGNNSTLVDILASGDMVATAKKYDIELGPGDIDDLNEFKDYVRKLPTEYFETKFERPVMLDEFKKAVVPDNLPADLRKALENAGLEIVQYPAGDTAARERVTLDAVKGDQSIMFQIKSLGAPYQGSKGQIATRIVDALPSGKRFVDLFSGGGAVTHAAMLSGKYEGYRMNDINPAGQELFLAGMRGDYRDYQPRELTAEEFKAIKGTPEGLLLSYSGLGRNVDSDKESVARRLRRVQRLEELKPYADQVEPSNTDYREVQLQPGDVVYADIPYEGTNKTGYREGAKFDKQAFSDWALGQDVPIYVSEQSMPEGWVEVQSWDMKAMRGKTRGEKLFVQAKFAGDGGNATAHGTDQEMADIEQRARKDGTWMKAPNGKPSKLNERQWLQVRTSAFKNWFGDWENDPENASKVVDENGEPLVVYHGSPYGAINIFDHTHGDSGLKEFGSYFTTNKAVAEMYRDGRNLSQEIKDRIDTEIARLEQMMDNVRNIREYDEIENRINILKAAKEGKIYEVFLNIRNPKEFDAKGKDGYSGWFELKQDVGYDVKSGTEAIEAISGNNSAARMQEKYDGIIAHNLADIHSTGDVSEYVGEVFLVFEPNAIKSATDNNGDFDPNNPDIRFRDDDEVAERDREYREAVEKKDDAAAQKLVDDAAKAAGMATDESGKLIDLYHGTDRFGFTIFDRLKSRMGAFFTSTRRNVAANYAGDDHYAFVRKINKGYKQDDSQEGILNNARSVFDQDWKMATEEQKEAIVTKVEADARKVADEIDKRRVDAETLPADEELDIFNAVAWVEDLFYTVAYAKENGNEGEDLYRLVSNGVERYNENKQVIRDYVSKHYDELDEKQKNYLNYLTGWDSGDVAIDIECSYMRVVSGKDLATVTGASMLTLDELKKNTDEAHNIGAYHLYGNLGDNPLVVDAEGKNWYSLEYEGRKFDTDTLAQYAKENGYTALVVKNVYDYGDKADDYIFFEPSQLKSADPATYDDNGNVIPLSQRFNMGVDDMRFREILEDGGTLRVYQSEGKWRVEGVPGEFDTQFGAVDNARNFLQGHVFEVAEDGNSIEVLGAGSNLDNMQSSNKRAEERARKWRERTVANGRRRVEELGQRLGVKVTIVDDMSEQEREGMSKKKRRAKGWYDVRTGEVFINLGNHRTVSDIEATFLHEVVAHKGLRRLFGEEFNTFLHNVYYNVDASIREEINRLMAKNNWDYREATEEYLAKLAQQMDFERPEKYVRVWETVKTLFNTLLQKMGFGNGLSLNDHQLRGILFESYHNMEKEGIAGLAESSAFYDQMEREARELEISRSGAGIAAEPFVEKGAWQKGLDAMSDEALLEEISQDGPEVSGTFTDEYDKRRYKDYLQQYDDTLNQLNEQGLSEEDAKEQLEQARDRWNSGAYMTSDRPYIKATIDALEQYLEDMGYSAETKRLEELDPKDYDELDDYLVAKRDRGDDPVYRGELNAIDDYQPGQAARRNDEGAMFRDDEDELEDFEDSEDFYEEELEEEADNAEDLGEEVDDSEAGESTFQEMMLGKMLQAANSAGAAQSARVSAMRSLGGALQQIRKAMSTQRNYDRETVNTIVRLAREVMASGYFNDLTRGEVKRLLAAAKNANGSANVTEQANKVVDTLLRHHLRECENLLKKQLKVKGSKTNTSGVEVQAGLDIEGQRMATAMKQGMRLDEQGLSDRVADCLSRMGSSDPVVSSVAAQEYTGLMLAQQYHDTIKASRQEEQQMREEMRQAKAEFAARRDSLSPEELKRQRQDLKDYIAATEDAIRQNRMERADAYNQLSEMLGGGIASSMERAKQWRDEQRDRVSEIQHNANSDLQDVPADEHMNPTWKHRMANWSIVRFFMKPLATFDYMLRMMGQKSPNGEGYLWNRFMGGWVEANDKEWRNVKAAHQVLDDKVKEVFNADRPGLPKFKVKRWSDLFFIERKMKGMDVDFWDDDRIKTRTLTPGNLLYIYMANKMSDGKMKLRKMGISEEDVEAIKNHLDPRLIELADWLQDEFLVQKRIEYNAVHERMFGAPMAAIENYFPLKINKLSRSQEEDVNNQDANPDENRGSTITGAIIKRVRNNKALDITRVDAFDVILEHIQTMEHWAAFAEFNRDLNALLSYKRFRNRMYNMASARFGSGEKLWTNFKRVCAIASGVYRPRVDRDSVDTSLVNVAKGVTRAKISFRFYTALKQLLSYPAYLSTANPIELIKSSNPVGAVKAWNWAIDNLPGFAERWQSRQAGDTRLKESDADWGLWKSKIIDTASRWGMSPNAFIDGLTVAMGAKAIYETKFKQLKKLGYSDEQAKQRALRDASVAYNETQQSSANAYTSAMQLDRTAASVALTVFRNASMGYQRRLFQSFANLKHMATKGYKEQSLYYLAKQMERDGLDIPTAKAAAEKVYNRALYQNIADVAIFGWVMQAAWNLGAYLPYLFMGDDDDDKKEMLTDAALHAIAGGIEGLTGGSVMSDTYNTIRSGEANMYSNELLPLLSDIESLKRTFKKDVIEGANDLVNLIIQAGVGVNPQTITDWVVAGLDVAKGDPRLANEFGLLVMRVMSAPQGQLDKLYIDELGLTAGEAKQLNAEEFAQRYARYKMGRESTFTGWAYSDEGRNDAFDRYVKNFDRKLKERIDAQDIETLADAYDRGDGHMKGLIEKAIKKKIAELDDTALQSMTSNNGNGKITKIVRSEINKRAKAKAAGMTPEEFSEFNKRVKASVANASDEELRDMYNQADTLARKIIRTALDESIDPEVGDPYKSPNKEYGRIYNRIKTADDMEEDILLAKAQKVAKAAGDDDLAKEIASARSELTEYRKELTGGAGDAQVMKELREARKELINEYVKSK